MLYLLIGIGDGSQVFYHLAVDLLDDVGVARSAIHRLVEWLDLLAIAQVILDRLIWLLGMLVCASSFLATFLQPWYLCSLGPHEMVV